MADYTEQLNTERIQNIKKTVKKKKEPNKASEITAAEFMLIGFIALIADLLGPFGFPCVLILLLWCIMKFHKFPTKRFIGAGFAEVISFGFLPGWSGFVLVTFLKQNSYLPKWTNRSAEKKV